MLIFLRMVCDNRQIPCSMSIHPFGLLELHLVNSLNYLLSAVNLEMESIVYNIVILV